MHRRYLLGTLTVLASLVVTSAEADRAPPIIRLYHLTPLNERDFADYSEFVKMVSPKADRRLAGIYIGYGHIQTTFVGIYRADRNQPYYILYANQIGSDPIEKDMIDISNAFAEEVADKLGRIIGGQTRNPSDAIPLLGCLGGKDYVFESEGVYGSSMDCVTSGPARKLFQVTSDLVALTQIKASAVDQRELKMEAIRSNLAAAMTLDQPEAKQECRQIAGEYQHWNGYPLSERIATADGNSFGLIPSFEWARDLQAPLYSLPGSLNHVLDADEVATGDFTYCPVSQIDGLDASEQEPIELGWIKSFKPKDSSAKAEFIRQVKIAAIRAAYTYPGTIKFRRVDVSFDYLDGVISDAKLEKTSYPNEDDAALLPALTKWEYPNAPAELKGQKLHIELPIYLGVTN